MKYTFYWSTGEKEILEGKNSTDALNNAGYGKGALSALDFFSRGEDNNYIWENGMWHREEVKNCYSKRYNDLKIISEILLDDLKTHLNHYPRIDRIIITRPKLVSKTNKKKNNTYKYSDPLNQIQDQIEARIITFYLSDVEKISKIITEYYTYIEQKKIKEFGYEGKHFILFIPDDMIRNDINKDNTPNFFELQILSMHGRSLYM